MIILRVIVELFGCLAVGGEPAAKIFATWRDDVVQTYSVRSGCIGFAFSVSSPAAAKGDAPILRGDFSTALPVVTLLYSRQELLRPM